MKKVMQVLLGTAVVGSLITGCQNTEVATTNETTIETPVVTRRSVESWGAVDVETTKEIHIEFPATISEVFVKEGQEVKAGDKLLSLDYEAYKAEINKKEKQLELTKSQLNQAVVYFGGKTEQISNLQNQANEMASRLAEGTDSDITVLQATWVTLENTLKEKEKDLEANKSLLEVGGISQREMSNIEIEIRNIQLEMETLQQKITNTTQDKNEQINNLKAEMAQIKSSMSDSERTNEQLAETYLVNADLTNFEIELMKAKYIKEFIKENDVILDIPNGIVKSIKVAEGSQVGGGSGNSCLMQILDQDSLVIKANVSEEFIKEVQLGAEVDIIPYADREAVVKGYVIEIQNMAVNSNGEIVIPVTIKAEESNAYLKYGYSVDVEIYTE